MILAPRLIALPDACVLYPTPIRDLLLHLASFNFYTPKWTIRIQEDWTRKLLKNRQDLTEGQLQKMVAAIVIAFSTDKVEKYELLIAALDLPDPDDQHILAAAVRHQVMIIVTANLKEFPAHQLTQFDIEAQHPDVLSPILSAQIQRRRWPLFDSRLLF